MPWFHQERAARHAPHDWEVQGGARGHRHTTAVRRPGTGPLRILNGSGFRDRPTVRPHERFPWGTLYYGRGGAAHMAFGQRLVSSYHGLFHIAQATMHDRWVKWLRLIAFLAASSIATQIVLRNVLGIVGLGNLIPSSVTTVLIASAVWLVAYPTMWLRMLTVVAEMEAKKECEAVLHEIEKLHPLHRPGSKTAETPRSS